jgi:hypothetical protein
MTPWLLEGDASHSRTICVTVQDLNPRVLSTALTSSGDARSDSPSGNPLKQQFDGVHMVVPSLVSPVARATTTFFRRIFCALTR